MLAAHFLRLVITLEYPDPADPATTTAATHRYGFQHRRAQLEVLHTLQQVLIFPAEKLLAGTCLPHQMFHALP
jgi:hypothetical protein